MLGGWPCSNWLFAFLKFPIEAEKTGLFSKSQTDSIESLQNVQFHNNIFSEISKGKGPRTKISMNRRIKTVPNLHLSDRFKNFINYRG